MAPHVDGLVVEHEERAADLAEAVEINAVAPLDVLVVYQVTRGVTDVSYEGLQLGLADMADLLDFVHVLIRSL